MAQLSGMRSLPFRSWQAKEGIPASPPFHYVYVLRSEIDHKFYIGFTSDLKARLKLHELGKVPATKPRRPLQLMFYEAFANQYGALRREKYLKSSKGKQTLRTMLQEHLQSVKHMRP